MNEPSVQILIAEYQRLQSMEQYVLESFEHARQLYLTVITAATGALVIFANSSMASASLQVTASIVLGLIFLFGMITFLAMLGDDIVLLKITKRYHLIREEFIQITPTLATVFPTELVQDTSRVRFWSSVRGIVSRVFYVSGRKTTVVLLNCLVAASIVIAAVWPTTIEKVALIFLIVAPSVGLLHALYASWRYRKSLAQLTEMIVGWWV